ncbi:MAG: T9SS type A sorting domain-containing protein [candidate division Zixibacteria bacterium]|nr:T9SS type A sorting domain-containing protein [candidate division Zixibacteria bacterium]
MSNCKMFLLLSVLTLAFIGLSGGVALAGVESIPDAVNFNLTESTIFIAGSTDTPANELATLNFEFEFDPGVTGVVTGTYIRLVFDPSEMDFIEARPTDAWGTEGVTAQPARVWDDEPENEDTIVYDIITAYPFAVMGGVVALAEFDFTLLCQPSDQVNDVNILYAQELTHVSTTAGNYVVNTPLDRIDHGSVTNESYNGEFWVVDTDGLIEYEGILGEHIFVPILLQSNFRLGFVDVYIEYDTAKLSYAYGDFEVVGDHFYLNYVLSNVGPGMIRVALVEYNNAHQFNDPTEEIRVGFTVKGNWQGDECPLTISSLVTPPEMHVGDGAGWCEFLDPLDHTFNGGAIAIDAYAASYSTELLDGYFSLYDDQAEVQVSLTNNFPAGLDQNSIIANFNLGMDLEAKWITWEAIDFGMSSFGGGPVDPEELSLRRYFDPGFMEIFSDPQPMVSFRMDKSENFTVPTEYDNRFTYFTCVAPWDGEPQFSAKVVDTTGGVNLSEGAGLTWIQPDPIEFLMGEYYCPCVQAGDCNITQTYYTQHNFTLDDFRVKIEVSGPHYMYEVIPIEGVAVESFDTLGYKWVILSTVADPSFEQAPTEERTAFANITYTRSGGSNLVAKETAGAPDEPSLPGPGNYGHWETRTSTVSFEYDSPGEFYMAEASTDLEHHVVAIGGTVVSKWWVTYDVNQLLFGSQLPEDFELLQNYPNPFNPSTEIAFGLPNACQVELSIYNIAGQLVETLVAERMEAGWHSVTWDGAGFASGIYLYRIQAGDYTESQKMILLK